MARSSAAAESPRFWLFTILNQHERHMALTPNVAGLFLPPCYLPVHALRTRMTQAHAAAVIPLSRYS
jgi:hypothetical protein